jgi:hypothetical protein
MELTDDERALILARRKASLPQWQPKPLASYTTEEKVARFDREYGEALRMLRAKEAGQRIDEDEEHWAYEARMELLGPGFWDYWNKL